MSTPNERLASEARVRVLLAAVAAAFPNAPMDACAWLHAARPEFGGLSPAGAAWLGPELARLAQRLLVADARHPGTRTSF